jgi:hypothetical protein
MATFNIPAQTILANMEKDSPSVTVGTKYTDALVQLTDPNNAWKTTAGNVRQWGIQRSTDGGTTWSWFLYQTNLPFGSLDGAGGMPSLELSTGSNQLAATDRLRLSILTDTNIVLGASVTVS